MVQQRRSTPVRATIDFQALSKQVRIQNRTAKV
jgi:hypothetical protein